MALTNLSQYSIPEHLLERWSTGVAWLDEILSTGGGLVPSQVVMLSGSPGCGKSTTILRALEHAGKNNTALLASLEESYVQIKLACRRLRINENFAVTDSISVEEIISQFRQLIIERARDRALLVVDSRQCLTTDTDDDANIVRELTSFAKGGVALGDGRVVHPSIILINQVTKSGTRAGKNKDAHWVDTVLSLNIEKGARSPWYGLRVLTAEKNRFGATDRASALAMTPDGLVRVADFDASEA